MNSQLSAPTKDDHYWFYMVCAGCGYHWQCRAVEEAIPNGGSLSIPNEDGSCPKCKRWMQAGDEFDLMRHEDGMSQTVRVYKMP